MFIIRLRKHAHAVSAPLNPVCIGKRGICRIYIISHNFFYKHRMWVLVRTASVGQFLQAPQSALGP